MKSRCQRDDIIERRVVGALVSSAQRKSTGAWHKRFHKLLKTTGRSASALNTALPSAAGNSELFSVSAVTSLVKMASESALEGWQEHEGESDDDGREKCAQNELQWANAPIFKLRLQN
jgi:hypothetical protein